MMKKWLLLLLALLLSLSGCTARQLPAGISAIAAKVPVKFVLPPMHRLPDLATLVCEPFRIKTVMTRAAAPLRMGITVGPCHVGHWQDIVAVSGGNDHSVGLKADGTVVAVGRNVEGQCDVQDWTDIVAIAAGHDHTLGLKSDGTVVAAGRNASGECEVADWRNVVAISAGADSVGLTADGQFLYAGDPVDDPHFYFPYFSDGKGPFTAVARGSHTFAALKPDRSVLYAGNLGPLSFMTCPYGRTSSRLIPIMAASWA